MPGRTGEIAGRIALTEHESAQVRELIAHCNKAERLDLKVDLEGLRGGTGDSPGIFLVHRGNTLAGFCTLDGGREIELCGAVHPDYRRQGIGRALLDAACQECRRRGGTQLLLICEEGSRSGQGFVAKLDARHAFTELRMERDVGIAGVPDVTGSLMLRPATRDDQPAIAHMTALAFERDEAGERRLLAAEMENTAERFIIALHGNAPIGTLKIFFSSPRALIYGFAVLPDHQGQGYGREMLNRTIRLLADEGWPRVGLEVDTENTRACHLYTSAGFQHSTTYGYFALPL